MCCIGEATPHTLSPTLHRESRLPEFLTKSGTPRTVLLSNYSPKKLRYSFRGGSMTLIICAILKSEEKTQTF
jgi:hypothetical protein